MVASSSFMNHPSLPNLHQCASIKMSEPNQQPDLDVPEDVVFDILQRIRETKPLLRFMAVSKSFKTIICSPSFIYRHLDLYNKVDNTVTRDPHHLVHHDKRGSYLHVASLSDKEEGRRRSAAVEDVDHETAPPPIPVQDYENFMSGPVNGIYSIEVDFEPPSNQKSVPRASKVTPIMLWNPGNRHTRVLPPLPPLPLPDRQEYLGGGHDFAYGFGFDSSSNDYCVIGISNFAYRYTRHKRKVLSCFHLYSLATNSWKRLEDPFQTHIYHDNSKLIKVEKDRGNVRFLPELWRRRVGVYLNSATHWVYDIEQTQDWKMLCFDFRTQVFRVYSLPRDRIINSRVARLTTISIDGSSYLALICCNFVLQTEPYYHYYDQETWFYDVYAMREYGVQESWTRVYRVPVQSRCSDFIGIVDHEFFVKEVRDELVSYHLGEVRWGDEFEEVEQVCHEYGQLSSRKIRVLPYRGSLVPIKPCDELSKKKKKKKKNRNHY